MESYESEDVDDSLNPEYKSDANAASRGGGRAVALSMAGGLLFTVAYGAWWVMTPLHAYSVQAADGKGTLMVLDSAKVRAIVESAAQTDLLATAEAMGSEANTLVAQGSFVRLFEQSRASCGDPSLAGAYARVLVTSGPSRGKEGWLCYRRDFAPTIWLQ